MEQHISLLPSQSKVHLLLLINPSDKIFNFLAIDIRNFPRNNIIPIYINIAISFMYHNELHEQLANVAVSPPTTIGLDLLHFISYSQGEDQKSFQIPSYGSSF